MAKTVSLKRRGTPKNKVNRRDKERLEDNLSYRLEKNSLVLFKSMRSEFKFDILRDIFDISQTYLNKILIHQHKNQNNLRNMMPTCESRYWYEIKTTTLKGLKARSQSHNSFWIHSLRKKKWTCCPLKRPWSIFLVSFVIHQFTSFFHISLFLYLTFLIWLGWRNVSIPKKMTIKIM